MSLLPRVTEHTREAVAREFDDLGPDACVHSIQEELRINNPELLDMAQKCANDVGDPRLTMMGLCMFYRLLALQSLQEQAPGSQDGAATHTNTLPRVTAETRDRLVEEIDERGPTGFTTYYIERLEQQNPELLQMAHAFASGRADYPQIMQGVALLWAALVTQLQVDRARMH